MTTEMLNPRDVARLTGLSYHAVLRAIRAGELTASKRRGRILIKPEWFEAWLTDGLIERPATQKPHVPAEDLRARPLRSTDRGSLAVLKAIEGGSL